MKNLIYHTSEHKVNVLDPDNYKEKAICFSKEAFISALGEWLYIFDYDELITKYNIVRMDSSGCTSISFLPNEQHLRFKSQPLGIEYRVFTPIDVELYALGVAKNFNILRGCVEEMLSDRALNIVRGDFR